VRWWAGAVLEAMALPTLDHTTHSVASSWSLAQSEKWVPLSQRLTSLSSDTDTNSSQWIIGNTFPFVVFGSFGAFWFTFGMTLTPSFNASTAYTVAGGAAADDTVGFPATFGKACPHQP
jgi:hypothetical protein